MTGSLLTPREAAARLRVSVDYLVAEAKAGRLGSVRLGTGSRTFWRFTEEAIAEYVVAHTAPSDGEASDELRRMLRVA